MNASQRYIILGRGLRRVLATICLYCLVAPTSDVSASDSAVIIMYHRFGEALYPSTNVSLEQFDAHVEELVNGPYSVLPIPEIIDALRSSQILPDRTVGISIDDAYRSVYDKAWPRLREAGLPFTLFIATKAVDRKSRNHMSWEQIRKLRDAGVTIGSQTHMHLHMPTNTRLRNEADINASNRRFIDELGVAPTLFAYPYGEMSLEVRATIRDAGFLAAFGQHSGVAHSNSDRYFLPRFAFNEAYGGLDRLRIAVNALPLPVYDITPADPLITQNPPVFGFSVDPTMDNLNRIACYNTQQGRLRLERLGNRRIELRFSKALSKGRARINCTLPASDRRWRWFGHQFFIKID